MRWPSVLQQGWDRMARRERLLVVFAAVLLVLALLWLVALAPALKVLRNAPVQMAQLDTQLQAMQALAMQAREMQARPALSRDETLRALESSLRQGLGATAQLRVAGDRATVELKAVAPEQLAQWLGQVRAAARVVVSQAKLVRAAKGWDGSLVLDLPPPP